MQTWSRQMVAAVLGLAAVVSIARADTPADAIIVAKQIDQLISLDPAEVFEPGSGEITASLYDRLVTYGTGSDPAIVPSLASAWSVSDDGMTYTFTIPSGHRFASGRNATATDAAFSLQRAVKLDKAPSFILTQFGWTKDNVDAQVRATDPQTLILTTGEKVAPTFFLNCLTSFVASVVDARDAQANATGGDLGNGWLKAHSAGTGAYKLRIWRPGETIILDANPNAGPRAPRLPHLIFRAVPEPATQLLLLQKGDVDYARDLTPDQIGALRDHPAIAVDREPTDFILYLGLNQNRPELARPEVREALRSLVDYDGIETALLGSSFAAHQSLLPTGYLGAIDGRPYRLDVAHAKDLLAKAGLGDGFRVGMDTRNVWPYQQIAQTLQATFAQAGITLDILPGSGQQTMSRYRAGEHEIYIGLWGSDYRDPHSNADAFADSLAKRNRWTDNAHWKELVAAARAESDGAKRAAIYQDLQQDIVARGPYVFMFEQSYVTAHRKAVSGLHLTPFSTYREVVKSN